MKHIQTNRFGSFIMIGIIAAFLASCKKNSNDVAPVTPLVTSINVMQLQSSTLYTFSAYQFEYSTNNYLTKVSYYQNGTETEYAQYEYSTVDQIYYIEHRIPVAYSPYNGSSSTDVLNYKEAFAYDSNGNLATYISRTYYYGNGYGAATNGWTGGEETYTYNSDGSVTAKIYTLYSNNGSTELVTAVGTKVISLPSAGVKKIVYTNTTTGVTTTYTYNYDSNNNPFKNIAGSFQKLWVSPSNGTDSFDNGIFDQGSSAFGDIFSGSNLLSYTGTNNTSEKYSYDYNSSNYPTTLYAPNYVTVKYTYNQ